MGHQILSLLFHHLETTENKNGDDTMNNKVSIGYCPVCRQGILEIVKELSTGKFYICCDECEAEWITPENAIAGKNGSRNKYGKSVFATDDEINQLGWKKYLK